MSYKNIPTKNTYLFINTKALSSRAALGRRHKALCFLKVRARDSKCDSLKDKRAERLGGVAEPCKQLLHADLFTDSTER